MTSKEIAEVLAEEWSRQLDIQQKTRELLRDVEGFLSERKYIAALKALVQAASNEGQPLCAVLSVGDLIHDTIIRDSTNGLVANAFHKNLGPKPIVIKDETRPFEDRLESDEVTELVEEGLSSIWGKAGGIIVFDNDAYDGVSEGRFYTSIESLDQGIFLENMELYEIEAPYLDCTKAIDLFVLPLSNGNWSMFAFTGSDR